jgi:hypothetical protein
MQKSQKIAYLYNSEAEGDVREELQQMVLNGSYNTAPSYTPSSDKYPDGLMPFVDRHMKYLSTHPKLDASMYVANLRLMTRVNRAYSV